MDSVGLEDQGRHPEPEGNGTLYTMVGDLKCHIDSASKALTVYLK